MPSEQTLIDFALANAHGDDPHARLARMEILLQAIYHASGVLERIAARVDALETRIAALERGGHHAD
jgi:hypothetical protein